MANHLLDRQLETELNRNIDFILESSSKLDESDDYSLEVPNLTFDQALSEISKSASDITSIVNMLRPYDLGTMQQKQYCDPAVKSASILLLCSQIRNLQKLALAMRMADHER